MRFCICCHLGKGLKDMLIVRQITNFCRILVKSSLEDERKETALETQCFFAKYDLLPILIRFNALFS